MKVGDQYPLLLEGRHTVAYAVVEHIENGEVSLVIPATRVIMGLNQTLAPRDPDGSRVLLGAEEKEDDK